jgi:hypothetical protein
MTYYAGLDVSLKEVSICVVDDDGEVVAQGTAPAMRPHVHTLQNRALGSHARCTLGLWLGYVRACFGHVYQIRAG